MSSTQHKLKTIECQHEFDNEIFINISEEYYDKSRPFTVIKTDGLVKYDNDKYRHIKKTVKDVNKRSILVANRDDMLWVNRLLWECDNIIGVLYTDILDPYIPEAGVTSANRMLWDAQANKSSDNNKAFMSGWKNSYDNELFSKEELDEYVDNTYLKLIEYLKADTDALEVGIGSGMISDKLSPFCHRYDGCDISPLILDKLASSNKEKNITNINLYQCNADEVYALPHKYNVILMSSVTEYFSGYNYLRAVVLSCINALKDGHGVIFFGDVFDLNLKELYENDVKQYAQTHPHARASTSFSHELFIPYDYWYDLANSIPAITNISITRKLGKIHNEINRFRYDVLLTIDKSANVDTSNCNALHKYVWAELDSQ